MPFFALGESVCRSRVPQGIVARAGGRISSFIELEESAMIEVRCPSCGKPFRVPDEAAGKLFRCKGCQTTVSIPGGPTEEEEERSRRRDRNHSARDEDRKRRPEDWDEGKPLNLRKKIRRRRSEDYEPWLTGQRVQGIAAIVFGLLVMVGGTAASSGKSGAYAAGVVAGVIFGLLFIAVGIFYLIRG
ncbi:MAG TPA: hypothetical protein VKD72_31990 [Gemmataceae bacterium]|nr:hypothetical protein [Gemmataceae bacterium]